MADNFQIVPNNFALLSSVKTSYPVILEILKGHSLYNALTKTVNIPSTYLSQFWSSITFFPASPIENTLPHFQFQISTYTLEFDLNDFRYILDLPSRESFPGKDEFEPLTSDQQLFQDIINLGYSESLVRVKDFKRQFLPRIWCILFSILNRCLTPKQFGIDQGSLSILRIFQGVAYHRHYDYASILWEEIISLVLEKSNPMRARKYIPFSRFFAILINQFMEQESSIPRLADSPVLKMNFMRHLQANTGSETAIPLPIPSELLNLADQENESVKEYLIAFPPTVQPEPAGPSPGVSSASEGHRGLAPDSESGDSDRGVKRKNTERGGEGDDDNPDQSVQIPEFEKDGRIMEREKRSKKKNDNVSKRRKSLARRPIKRQVIITTSESETESDDEETESQKSTSDASEKDDSDKNDDGNDEDNAEIDDVIDDVNDDDNNEMESDIPHDNTDKESSDEEFDQHDDMFDFDNPAPESQMNEAEGLSEGEVEKIVSVSAETRVKEKETLSQNVSSRVNTSAIRDHVLIPDIEKDANYPLAHAHSPPTHSVSSQQETVSNSHGEYTHMLSTPHLERVDIEIGGQQPRSPTSFYTRSRLGQSQIPRAPVSSLRDYAHLRDVAGTVVGTTSVDVFQGSTGNPTSANIMPTLNVGHAVDSTVVSTGNLRDPGLFTLPQNIMDLLSQVIKDSVNAAVDPVLTEIKKVSKGKSVDTSSPPPTQTDSSPRAQPDQSIDELKSLLYAKLLSESTSLSADADLIMLLRQHNSSSQPATKEDLQVIIGDLISEVQTLKERMSILETTCRAQAESSVRRKDDQDDPDSSAHPEGEKMTSAAGVGVPTKDAEPINVEEHSTQQTDSNAESVELEFSTVEKPEDISVSADVEKENLSDVITVNSESDDDDLDVFIKEEKDEGLSLKEFEQISHIPDVSLEELFNENVESNVSAESSQMLSAQDVSSQGAGKFNKDERTIELRMQHNRTVLRYMFLEEAAWKIFSSSVKELNPVKVWGLQEINKRDHTEYFHFIRIKQQSINNVRTDHRIVSIKEIYCERLSKYYFPVFHVQRSDTKEWVFSEADFPLLNLEDIEYIYDYLSTLQIRPFDIQVALKAVKRNMKATMKLASIEDFQIGIEALQPKINLTFPNQQLEDVHSLPFGMIIEEPEFGIVYRNMKMKKIFIRFGEVAKYSDGTLKVIARLLKKKLEQEKIIKPVESDRELILKALKLVEDRLRQRNTIRRFEICYGQRPKKFFAFQPPR